MTFGEALSILLEEKGMQANEMSDKSGVTAPYISQLVCGKLKDPAFSKACKLVHALDMTLQEFIDFQEGNGPGKASRLLCLIAEKHENLLKFSNASGINYNTLYYSTRSDERVDKIPISNFIAIAHALDMTADELCEHIEQD